MGGLSGVMSVVDRVDVVCWRAVACMEGGGVTHLSLSATLQENGFILLKTLQIMM